jgi:hypothetical protein
MNFLIAIYAAGEKSLDGHQTGSFSFGTESVIARYNR